MANKTTMVKNLFPMYARESQPRANVIVEETKDAVVVDAVHDAPKVSGFLAEHIHKTATGCASDADYAGDVEYGTKWQKANPTFIQAHERHRNEMNQRLATELFEE